MKQNLILFFAICNIISHPTNDTQTHRENTTSHKIKHQEKINLILEKESQLTDEEIQELLIHLTNYGEKTSPHRFTIEEKILKLQLTSKYSKARYQDVIKLLCLMKSHHPDYTYKKETETDVDFIKNFINYNFPNHAFLMKKEETFDEEFVSALRKIANKLQPWPEEIKSILISDKKLEPHDTVNLLKYIYKHAPITAKERKKGLNKQDKLSKTLDNEVCKKIRARLLDVADTAKEGNVEKKYRNAIKILLILPNDFTHRIYNQETDIKFIEDFIRRNFPAHSFLVADPTILNSNFIKTLQEKTNIFQHKTNQATQTTTAYEKKPILFNLQRQKTILTRQIKKTK